VRKTPLLLKFLFLLPAVLFMPTALFADEVFLKGAGSISGRIVEQTETTVTTDVGSGTIGVALLNVDHIVKARTPLDDYDDRASRLGEQDVYSWRALARWAARQGLDKQARQAYEHVVALEPDDPEAQGALGYVLLDGNWVTEEEAYRARGFVKFEGEWMTPAEAQLRLDSAAAEQARQDAAESARQAELEKLKADVEAQYAAEAAADEEWRAEGATWFYSHAYPWGGWGHARFGHGPTTWRRASGFRR
jgi:hypothetical protein